MKPCLLTLTLLTSFTAFTQDWAFFPPDQGSFYNTNQSNHGAYENYDAIKYWSVDSIKNSLNEEVRYLNSKFLPATYQKCYTDEGGLYDVSNSTDSIVHRNDTTFYKIEHEANLFYFLPKAQEGESWIVQSEKKKDSIKITYEKKELAEFLGISDSVKRYSYQLLGIHADSTNIDEQSMLLSKQYGLIEYIDFNRLLSPYNSSRYYETLNLVGIEKDSLQIGYQLPSFKTFLPYAAGDILFWNEYWREAFGPNISSKFHLDTLTEVVENADSLYYVYNRTSINDQNEIVNQQSQQIQSFVFADFENIVGAKPNLWGFGKGTARYAPPEFTPQKMQLWSSVNHLIGADTVIIAHSHYFDNIIDTTLCQTESTGVSDRLFLESKRGLVAKTYDYFDQSYGGFRLMGSYINGVEEGTIEVIVGIEEEKIDQIIQLYPNPAKDFINLTVNPQWLKASYTIVDINGRLREEGSFSQQSINIADLPLGIYFLNVTYQQKTFTNKFVKQAF